MSKVDVVEILKKSDALLEGHFLLSSGKHSNRYVQCAKVLRYPEYAAQVLSTVVDQIKDLDIDLVVGPAMGGVIVSYELGRQLNKEAVFTERKDGVMQLRRGFEVKPGAKIIISEDVKFSTSGNYASKRSSFPDNEQFFLIEEKVSTYNEFTMEFSKFYLPVDMSSIRINLKR